LAECDVRFVWRIRVMVSICSLSPAILQAYLPCRKI
jgi:hypothetical protein